MQTGTQKSIKLNFVMNAILTLSTFVFPLITFPYISRILLPDGVGKLNFATSIIAYFNMFAQLGIPTYGVKACAQVRDDREKLTKTAHELLFINLIMTAISYIALIIAIVCIPKLREERTLYLIVSATILLSAIGMEWLYKALEEYTYITVRSVVFKLISIVAMFMLVHKQSDYVIYGAISVFASSASFIWNFFKAREYIDFRWMGDYDLKRHLKVVLIFFALACTTTIYTNLDNVMLGFMKTDTDVGLYGAAVKIKTVLVSIITSLGAVLLPRAAYYIEQGNTEEFKNITKKAMQFVILAAVPITVYFILFAEESIRFIAGDAFAGAVLPMQIIMPTVLFIGITNILGIEIMVPTGREKQVLYSTIIGAVVDLILNAILIPRYAATGAAIGTLAAEFAVLIYQVVILRHEIGEGLSNFKWWKLILAVIPAVAVSVFFKGKDYSNFKILLYSACIFFGIYAAILIFTKEEFTTNLLHNILTLPLFGERIIENIILTAFIALISLQWIENSVLTEYIPFYSTVFSFLKMLIYGIAVFVVLYNFVKDYYSQKEVIIIAAVGILSGLVFIKSKDFNILILVLFIVALTNVNLNRICKWSVISRMIIMVVVVGLALSGIIENRTILRADGTVREYLGFTWTTIGPNLLFYIALAWVYWRKEKITIFELVLILVGNVFFYVRTDTKSAFAYTILLVFASVILKYIQVLRKYRKIYGIANIIEIPLLSFGIIAITKFCNFDKSWVQKFNEIISGRLQLGKAAINNYGITVLGQNITWIGGDGIDINGNYAYNYVDSSFLQILLSFGILFLCIVILYLIVIAINGLKKQDTYMALVLILLVAHTTLDPQLLVISYDVFLMAFSYIGIGLLNRNEKN